MEWEDLPEWVNYRAQNHDGSWMYSEKRPRRSAGKFWVAKTGRSITTGETVEDWDKTLEQRPTRKGLK